jgi:integrase
LQRIRVILDWCRAHGFCEGDNPADGVTKVLPKHRGPKRHHAALPYQQVPAFIQALSQLETAELVRLAFELTILCATRTSETLCATWDEVDLDGNTWTIPATRMKGRVDIAYRCRHGPSKSFSEPRRCPTAARTYSRAGRLPSRSRTWCS